jgi:hypothetical protein
VIEQDRPLDLPLRDDLVLLERLDRDLIHPDEFLSERARQVGRDAIDESTHRAVVVVEEVLGEATSDRKDLFVLLGFRGEDRRADLHGGDARREDHQGEEHGGDREERSDRGHDQQAAVQGGCWTRFVERSFGRRRFGDRFGDGFCRNGFRHLDVRRHRLRRHRFRLGCDGVLAFFIHR